VDVEAAQHPDADSLWRHAFSVSPSCQSGSPAGCRASCGRSIRVSTPICWPSATAGTSPTAHRTSAGCTKSGIRLIALTIRASRFSGCRAALDDEHLAWHRGPDKPSAVA